MTVLGYFALAIVGYLLLNLAAVALFFRAQLRELWTALRSRGEVADGPDYYDTDVSQGMREARAALVDVRADRVELSRRFGLVAEELSDLSSLPQRLEDLYLIEVDR